MKRPPLGYDRDSLSKRLEWVKTKTGISLPLEEAWWEEDLQGLIEHPIGFVKIPTSIAGPLLIQGDYAKGEFLIPISTIEGTLSMSLTRGAYLISLAGGVKTHYLKQEIARSPVFFLPDMESITPFLNWVKENTERIRQVAESTTRYGKLLRIDPLVFGRRVVLDFIYTTGDAAGQNMVTIATQAACLFIEEALKNQIALTFLVESNFSGDKNPSYRNILKGRGHSATATVTLSPRLIKKFLQIEPNDLIRAGNFSSVTSAYSGMIGFNLHTANALAAIYLATGQDVACVAENGMGFIHSEILPDGNYEGSITLPSLTIGTVGGGTRLKSQNTNLKILGCEGENGAKKFAEIIAAAALALELSLGAAIVKGDFTAAHQKYGRKG